VNAEALAGLAIDPPLQLAHPASSLSLAAASLACQRAVAHACALGVRVNVAVVDRSGILIAFQRMPGAPLHSMDVAVDKAYTATSFNFPTREWGDVLATFSETVQKGILLRPRLVVFGGGVPLREQGELLGAIGVSGASEEQDEQCALAGVVAIGADRV